MTTRKRNEWLDVEESEEEVGSEIELEESRGNVFEGRSTKKRRISSDEEDEEDEDDHEDKANEEDLRPGPRLAQDSAGGEVRNIHHDKRDKHARYEDDYEQEIEKLATLQKNLSKKLSRRQPLTGTDMEEVEGRAHKSGVVYISRIPPFMKPNTLRQLLQPYGEVGRIFLTPEDPSSRQKRLRQGGNKKRTFTDGWVEFVSKRCAKLAAETLNTQIIGGKKGGYYHDDVWNIKYLKGFKWRHLTEQIAHENAERGAKMRSEIAKSTRENKEFVHNVERAKMLDNMQAKKKRRVDSALLSGQGTAKITTPMEELSDDRFRGIGSPYFKQNEVKAKTRLKDSATNPPEQVHRVLSKIF